MPSYFKDFLPTVEAMRPFVDQKLIVMSGAEFAIPLGFPENVITKFDFGFSRTTLPDVVVTSVEVFEVNKALFRPDPQLYHYLAVTFPATFEEIFRQGDYAIYRRRVMRGRSGCHNSHRASPVKIFFALPAFNEEAGLPKLLESFLGRSR